MAKLPAQKAAEREFAVRPRVRMPMSYRASEFAKAAVVALKRTLQPKRVMARPRLVVNNTGLRR